MVDYTYIIAKNEDTINISVFSKVTGESVAVDESNPNFKDIQDGILNEYLAFDDIRKKADVAAYVSDKFEELSERVKLKGGTLYFDNDPIDNSLAKFIVRCVTENVDDYKPFVKFLEKLYANPSEHSRNQLYNWLNSLDFTIDSDGDFYGYKGVQANKGKYSSIHQGHAIVDGKNMNGSIPNEIGSVIEMPRSEVTFDPSVGCSYGLHVGTWNYASSFARGAVLKVKVNPRDVVSVPNHDAQKLRVSRYEVIEVTESESLNPIVTHDVDNDFVESYDDYDDYDFSDYDDPYDWR